MSTQDESLSLPRLVLRVGALGNRQFGDANGIAGQPHALESAAAEKCREALEAMQKIVAKIHLTERTAAFPEIERPARFFWKSLFGLMFGRVDWWQRRKLAGQRAAVFSEQRALIQVLSGRAVGADQLIIQEARDVQRSAAGSDAPEFECLAVEVEVEGAMVQPADRANEWREIFSVGNIPRSLEPMKEPCPRETARARARTARQRAEGFRAQAEALRHHADILLAVWDADAEGKAGGTAETVEEALRARLPVLAVRFDLRGQATLDLLRTPEDLRREPGQVGWSELKTGLEQILCFPDPPPRDEHESHGHYTSYHPRLAFHQFLRGRLVQEFLSRPTRSDKPVLVAWPALVWPTVRALMDGDERTPSGSGKRSHEDHTTPKPGTFAAHYGAAQRRASALSEAFGHAHRGGITWSYLLAAAAVLLGLAGIRWHEVHAPAALLVGVAVLEVLSILALWALAETSAFEDWHEAYTDLRILAEALRGMKYLGPLGVHVPLPKLPPHLAGTAGPAPGPAPPQDPRRLWSVWYFRALVRNAPLRLEADLIEPPCARRLTLLEKWIGKAEVDPAQFSSGSQLKYHHRNRRAQGRLFHRLEKIAGVMFLLVFAAVALHLLAVLFAHEPTDSGGVLSSVCFWLGIGGPVLLAATNGFLAQIECVRLRQRSEGMLRLLAERHRVLTALDVTTNPQSVEARWRLAAEAVATAGLMVDETAGWALIYKSADIHAG